MTTTCILQIATQEEVKRFPMNDDAAHASAIEFGGKHYFFQQMVGEEVFYQEGFVYHMTGGETAQ